METPQIDIVRGLPTLTLRQEGDGATGMPTLFGHFSRFDEWYEIHSYWEGDFIERFVSGSFDESFAMHWDEADPHRTKVQFQHGWDTSVGMRLLGKLSELREDDQGGYYEAPLFATSYNADLIPGLAAGEYGASFRFRVMAEEWDEEPGTSAHNPKGLPERSITKARVFEVGPVAFGASPTATAGLRSLTDEYYEAMRTAAPSLFAEACRATGREVPPPPAASAQPDQREAGSQRTRPRSKAGRRAERTQLVALPDAVLARGVDLAPITTVRRGQERVEARRVQPDVLVRDGDDGKIEIETYLLIHDEPRGVGDEPGWSEVWSRGACTRTIDKGPDVRLTLDGEGLPLARSLAGDLRLTSDDLGLHMKATVDPSSRRGERAAVVLQRGDPVELMVSFDIVRHRWDEACRNRVVEEVRLDGHDIVICTADSEAARRALDELSSIDLVEPDEQEQERAIAAALRTKFDL